MSSKLPINLEDLLRQRTVDMPQVTPQVILQVAPQVERLIVAVKREMRISELMELPAIVVGQLCSVKRRLEYEL